MNFSYFIKFTNDKGIQLVGSSQFYLNCVICCHLTIYLDYILSTCISFLILRFSPYLISLILYNASTSIFNCSLYALPLHVNSCTTFNSYWYAILRGMLFTPFQWSTGLTPSFALFTCLFRHLGNLNQVGKPIN